MSYFPLLSNPFKPKHPHVFTLSICLHVGVRTLVDLEGFEPSSNSLSWDTLRL